MNNTGSTKQRCVFVFCSSESSVLDVLGFFFFFHHVKALITRRL